MQNANRERNGGLGQWGAPPLAVCGRTAPPKKNIPYAILPSMPCDARGGRRGGAMRTSYLPQRETGVSGARVHGFARGGRENGLREMCFFAIIP